MPRPRLSPEERKQRRREAALERHRRRPRGEAGNGHRPDRRARLGRAGPGDGTGKRPLLPRPPRALRLQALAMERGAAAGHLDRFLDGFIRPDGTVQPVPHRRRKSR